MAELGALPNVVGKCLNHTEEVGKVKRIYQRAQYEGPMREAWRLLGTRLALLQGMADGSVINVVPCSLGANTNGLCSAWLHHLDMHASWC